MEVFEKFQCGCKCGCCCVCGCKQNPQILFPVASYQPYQTIVQSNVGYENQNFSSEISEIDLHGINAQINLQIYNEINRHHMNNNNEWSNETNTTNINTNSNFIAESLNNDHLNGRPNMNKRKKNYKNNLNNPTNHNPYYNIRAKNIKKKQFTFNLYCLPYGDLSPKIPRKTAELRSAGLIKGLTISNDDLNDEIKNAIEELFPCLKGKTWRFFRCKTTSDLEVANEPEIGWNAGALKIISGVRKKLYLGTII
ncbi:unnamed protein product [Rhizophagus irregularis]|nr:unnamed protein product [Rhizophagus irregularis]